MDTSGTGRKQSAQTPREVARHARCRDKLVYAAIHAGELVAYRIGNTFRVFPKDRDRWLSKHRAR